MEEPLGFWSMLCLVSESMGTSRRWSKDRRQHGKHRSARIVHDLSDLHVCFDLVSQRSFDAAQKLEAC